MQWAVSRRYKTGEYVTDTCYDLPTSLKLALAYMEGWTVFEEHIDFLEIVFWLTNKDNTCVLRIKANDS